MLRDIIRHSVKMKKLRLLNSQLLPFLFVSIITSIVLGCERRAFLKGEITSVELRVKEFGNECDYNHITLALTMYNKTNDSTIILNQGANNYNQCALDSLSSLVKWILPDSAFYLIDEGVTGNDLVIQTQEKKTFKFRNSFEAKGDYLMSIHDNYRDYLNNDFKIEIQLSNKKLSFKKSDHFEIFYYLGNQKIDPKDSIVLNFYKGPSLLDMKESSKIMDSLIEAIPETGEPSIDLDSI